LLRIRISWLLCVRSRQVLLVVEPLLLLCLLLEAIRDTFQKKKNGIEGELIRVA